MAVMNPPEKKLEKRTSVQYAGMPVQIFCVRPKIYLHINNNKFQNMAYLLDKINGRVLKLYRRPCSEVGCPKF